MTEDSKEDNKVTATDDDTMDGVYAPSIAPQDFEHSPGWTQWMKHMVGEGDARQQQWNS